MVLWQDDVQNLLLGAKFCIWRMDAKLAALGWGLAGASATAGDWTGTGGSLVEGNWRVRRCPASAPFRFDLKYTLAGDGVTTNRINIEVAPLVGVAGGWNEGGASFDAPVTFFKEFFVNASGRATNFNIVVNDRALILWAYWTPPTAQATTLVCHATDRIESSVTLAALGVAVGSLVTVVDGGGTNNGATFHVASLDDANTMIVTPYNGGPAVADNASAAGHLTVANTHYLGYFGRFLPQEILTSFEDSRPVVAACGVRDIVHAQGAGFAANMRRVYAKTSGGYIPLAAGTALLPTDAVAGTSPLTTDAQAYSTASAHAWSEALRMRWSETVSAIDYRDHGGRMEGMLLTSAGHVRKQLGRHPTDPSKCLYMSHGGFAHVWPNGGPAAA